MNEAKKDRLATNIIDRCLLAKFLINEAIGNTESSFHNGAEYEGL